MAELVEKREGTSTQATVPNLNWPLMTNNITRDDLNTVVEFLRTDPRLTQADNVAAFEAEWSRWLGVEHSVFVNSGASANLITIAALKHLYGPGEIIVPPLTWVSDIAAVINNGFTPVFIDIDPTTLCMDAEQVIAKLSHNTRAVFLSHVQGFNGLNDRLLTELTRRRVPLIEDVCESHGATFGHRKLGSFGLASNFSFYFAHHMSTIEGGMICTCDPDFYQTIRMLRSHGMVREASDDGLKENYASQNPDLNPDFIFAYPAFNCRNTEIGAVIGRNQLHRLDVNNHRRRSNFKLFLDNLDPTKYRTDFNLEGSCNYALNLILKHPDPELRNRVEDVLRKAGVEFRRGSSGGGNQLRQPYLKTMLPNDYYKNFPHVEHVHFYGYYIGNYPHLETAKIIQLAALLNAC